jgi:hypothetical protein
MKAEAEQARERFDDECFGDAGDAFEKDVALAEQGHQRFVDDFGLAGDDAGHLSTGVIEKLAGGVELRVSRLGHAGAFLRLSYWRI